MVRLLQPWFANNGKRVVKAPKFYIRDSGLFHALMGLKDQKELLRHPKLGASWEGFALEEVLKHTGAGRNAYFWGTHGGAELDLLLTDGNKRKGVEFKYLQAPSTTKSMHVAMADLKLDRLLIVYPGERAYALAEKINVVPVAQLKKYLT